MYTMLRQSKNQRKRVTFTRGSWKKSWKWEIELLSNDGGKSEEEQESTNQFLKQAMQYMVRGPKDKIQATPEQKEGSTGRNQVQGG